MNTDALRERQNNMRHISAFDGGFHKVLIVDCDSATYKGEKVRRLDSFKRRKFENLLVFSEAPQPIKVRYVNT
jgi:hypothetical protein